MRGRALPGALAVSAVTGLSVLAGASPAAAYVCAFGIDSPAAGSVAGAPSVPLSGPFVARQGQAPRILEVTFLESPGPRPDPFTRRDGELGSEDRYDVRLDGLSRNGRYRVRVVARHAGTSPGGLLNCDGRLGQDRRSGQESGEVSFGVSVRANPPTDVAARFDAASRTVTVSWRKSGDPDIKGYTITRAGAGSFAARDVPPDPQSWTDPEVFPGAATVTYSISASRNGPDGATSSPPSAPVASAPVDVPAPPPAPTSTTTPGPPGGTGGGTTGGTTDGTAGGGTPAVGGTSPVGGPGSSSPPAFTLGPVAGATSPPGAPPPLRLPGDLNGPDGAAAGAGGDEAGYRPLVPYAPGSEQDGRPVADGDDQAVVASDDRGTVGEGVPELAYVASGLLSTVIAAHVLWVRRQALRPEGPGASGSGPPLEPLDGPGGPGPGPAPAVSPFGPEPAAPASGRVDATSATGGPPPILLASREGLAAAAPAALAGAGAMVAATRATSPTGDRRPLRAARSLEPEVEPDGRGVGVAAGAVSLDRRPLRAARSVEPEADEREVKVAAAPEPAAPADRRALPAPGFAEPMDPVGVADAGTAGCERRPLRAPTQAEAADDGSVASPAPTRAEKPIAEDPVGRPAVAGPSGGSRPAPAASASGTVEGPGARLADDAELAWVDPADAEAATWPAPRRRPWRRTARPGPAVVASPFAPAVGEPPAAPEHDPGSDPGSGPHPAGPPRLVLRPKVPSPR